VLSQTTASTSSPTTMSTSVVSPTVTSGPSYTSASSTLPASQATNTASTQSSKLSSGAIAAIATSISFVFIVAILAGTFTWYKLKVRNMPPAPTDPSMMQHDSKWREAPNRGAAPFRAEQSGGFDTGHGIAEPTSGRLQYP
jgi:beta-lactamase regulating signal transducer with metallopeptidase domain